MRNNAGDLRENAVRLRDNAVTMRGNADELSGNAVPVRRKSAALREAAVCLRDIVSRPARLMVLLPDAPVPDAKKPEGQPTGGNVLTTDEQQKVLGLHNAIREANGVPKLEWDDKLAKYSAGWTHKDKYGNAFGLRSTFSGTDC
ncbi:hypothetical protein QFC20_002697 [Naganishia adeliensis]|uniref:Uncharacterized protein n=1 Tax=Naganishia adeliensis TaxID=92952 RepID=A0ACC2WHN1_9TREE|nr:hypothetical protein QFC20_002697 [Naganishia adeliensis]